MVRPRVGVKGRGAEKVAVAVSNRDAQFMMTSNFYRNHSMSNSTSNSFDQGESDERLSWVRLSLVLAILGHPVAGLWPIQAIHPFTYISENDEK